MHDEENTQLSCCERDLGNSDIRRANHGACALRRLRRWLVKACLAAAKAQVQSQARQRAKGAAR